jgi:hypothetical protein
MMIDLCIEVADTAVDPRQALSFSLLIFSYTC